MGAFLCHQNGPEITHHTRMASLRRFTDSHHETNFTDRKFKVLMKLGDRKIWEVKTKRVANLVFMSLFLKPSHLGYTYIINWKCWSKVISKIWNIYKYLAEEGFVAIWILILWISTFYIKCKLWLEFLLEEILHLEVWYILIGWRFLDWTEHHSREMMFVFFLWLFVVQRFYIPYNLFFRRFSKGANWFMLHVGWCTRQNKQNIYIYLNLMLYLMSFPKRFGHMNSALKRSFFTGPNTLKNLLYDDPANHLGCKKPFK